MLIHISFEGVLLANYPSFLPTAFVTLALPVLSCRGKLAFPSLKRYLSRGLWRDTSSAHSKRFGFNIVLSLQFGIHVLFWPLFLPTGSALGAPGSKSLHYYIFRVHISETTIITNSKLELCTRIGYFELLAAVLQCFQNLLQNPS